MKCIHGVKVISGYEKILKLFLYKILQLLHCYIFKFNFVFFSGFNFGAKKIILMTDFSPEFTDDNADVIINGLKNEEIELSVM